VEAAPEPVSLALPKQVHRSLWWLGYNYFSLSSSASATAGSTGGDANSFSGSGLETGLQIGVRLANPLSLVFLGKVGILFPDGGKMFPITGGLGLRYETLGPVTLMAGLGYCFTLTLSNNGVNGNNPNPSGPEFFAGPTVALGGSAFRFELLLEYGSLSGSVNRTPTPTDLSFKLFRINAGIAVEF
jgi:hypothetical protein